MTLTNQASARHEYDVFAWSIPGHSTLADTLIYRRWLPQVLPRVDAVLTDSEASRSDIEQYLPVDGRKLFLIPLGVHGRYSPRPTAETAALKSRHGLPERYLLFLGSVEERKNLRRLLQACARLWAAGEVTSSGLHGANRLASNSLLEGLVYGARAGRGASRAAADIQDDFRALPLENVPQNRAGEPVDLPDIRNSLKSLMWRAGGVRRNGRQLSEALEMIDGWRRYVQVRQFFDTQGWELQNMLTVARVMVRAALAREETRGVHFRTDHPRCDDQRWNRRLVFRRSQPEPVQVPPDTLKSGDTS